MGTNHQRGAAGQARKLSRAASPHLRPPRRATPSHEEASLHLPYARPQAANQHNHTHLDAQQRATLTQRDVHGGLFGGFGRKLAKRVKHARCSGQSPAHFHQHHRVLSLVYSYNAEQSKTICDLQSCDVTNPTHLLMSQTLRDLLFRPTYSGILTASVPDFTHDCGGTAMHVALHWGAIHEQ